MRRKFGKLRNTLIDGKLFETKKVIKHMAAKKVTKNIILGNDVYVDINSGIEVYKKSNFLYGDFEDIRECFMEPNILTMNMSYILKDYDGILYATYKEVFEEAGYGVKVINFIDFMESNKFNVFEYFNYEQDVTMFVNLVTEAYTANLSHSEKLIKNAEKELLEAILYYIMEELPHKEHNMKTLSRMLKLAWPYAEGTEEYTSDLDLLFGELVGKSEYQIALDKYQKFLASAVHIERKVIDNLTQHLAMYDINSIKSICNEDEVKLDEMIEHDEILFVVVPKDAKGYEKIADIFMYQAMMYMDYLADKKYKSVLPSPVHIMAPGMITPIVDIAIENCFKKNYIVSLGVDKIEPYIDSYGDVYSLIKKCSAFICYDYSGTETKEFVKKMVVEKYNSDITITDYLDPELNIELEDYMEMEDVECIICVQHMKAICADVYEADRLDGYIEVTQKEMMEYMESLEQACASQIYSNVLGAISKNIRSIKVGENVNIDIASKNLIPDRVYSNITTKVRN